MKIQEYQQNRRKKALFKPFSATFLTLVMLFIVLFSCNLASAWDWDNVKDYDEETKTVTITNALGLGDTIATAKLLTPLNVYVMRGKDRKVAEFEIINEELYSNALREMEFFDIKKAMRKFNRDFTYKYKKSLGFETVNDYETICEDTYSVNSTLEKECSQVFIGTHQEEIFEWIVLDPKEKLPKGKITVGIFTDVLPGEKVDWVPTFFGVRVPEWAVWTESLNVDLISYWKLDEISGTNAEDSYGTNNGTTQNMEDGDWQGAGIKSGLDFDGVDEYVNVGHAASLQITGNLTISVWIKTSETGTFKQIVCKDDNVDERDYKIQVRDNEAGEFCVNSAPFVCVTSGATTVTDGNWHHVVGVNDGTDLLLYVDGVDRSTGGTGDGGAMTNNNYDALIGTNIDTNGNPLTTQNFNGTIDEIAIWNRTLTSDEITQLYNEGNGITYISSWGPKIILNSPIANANLTSTSITFNCTVYDPNGVNNVSLYIDGVLNETNSSGINNSDYIFEKILLEGNHNWTCGAWNNDNETIETARDFTIDITWPTINLTAPPAIIDYHATGDNLTVNWTVADEHLDSCWYDYNGTNITVTCGDNTTQIANITDYNNRNLTFYANDTFGHLSSEFRSWIYTIFANDLTYNDQTFETSQETFEINITYDPLIYLDMETNLIYNGTSYLTTEYTVGNETIFNISIIIPIVNSSTNLTFYWNFLLNDGETITEINSTENNQTVSVLQNIEITDTACSAGFFEAVNYTFVDEGNFSALNVNIKYNFKFGLTELFSKVVMGTETNKAVLRVCINQTFDNYQLGYGEVEYQASGYVSRRFYMWEGQSLSNSTTKSYILYDLVNGDATSFLFEIKNTFLNPYVEKYVALLRWYLQENEYRVVEIARTDEEGKTVMKVKTEDVDYRIGLYELNGLLIKLADPVRMACLVQPCTYTLRIVQEEIEYFDDYNIEWSLTFDEANDRFIFIWNDPSQNTESFELIGVKDTGLQEIMICNSTASGYIGVLTCSIGNYTGLITAKAFRSASPEIIFATLSKTIRDAWNNAVGLFFSFIICLMMGLIAIVSPIAAIILTIVGLIPAVILGSITFSIFMGIAVLGGIIIHIIKRTK